MTEDDNTNDDTADIDIDEYSPQNAEELDITDYWAEVIQPRIEEVDEDPVEQGRITDDFVKALALATEHGDINATAADGFIGRHAKLIGTTKSSVEEPFEAYRDEFQLDETEEIEQDDVDAENGELPDTVVGLIHHCLDEIVVYNPTDQSADPKYLWHFEHGVEVETNNTEYKAPESFVDRYFAATDSEHNVSPELPDNFAERHGSWVEWVRDLMSNPEEYGIERTDKVAVGERTVAVRDLKDRLENAKPTNDLHTAASSIRPYYNEEDDVLEVPNSIVDRVTNVVESVGYNDIQLELDARDLRAGRVRGTQTGKGQNVRLWRLDPEWVDYDEADGFDPSVMGNGGDSDE